jgi:hypothetical protein
MASTRPALVLGSLVLLLTALVSPVHARAFDEGTTVAGDGVQNPDASQAFAMNVGRAADFVAQTNFVQCVGASMQMMLNMMSPVDDRTARTQLRLQTLARAWSGPAPSGVQRKGASVRGWASGLTIMGGGSYRLVGTTSVQAALRAAATAIRATGRPVGLLVWRGRHAWVMSGFTATADPARTSSFTVTGANIHDPLYPYGSSVWGPSPRPGELLSPSEVGRQFKPRRSRSSGVLWAAADGSASLSGQYVLVLPYEPLPVIHWTARVR